MSTTARKNRRRVQRIKQRAQDDEMTRFAWLVGAVIVLEIALLVFVASRHGFMSPLA